jgi:heat shock protein HslJ
MAFLLFILRGPIFSNFAQPFLKITCLDLKIQKVGPLSINPIFDQILIKNHQFNHQNHAKVKKTFLLIALLSMTILSCSKKEFTVEPTVVSISEVLGKWKLVRYEDLTTGEDQTQPEVKIYGEMTMTFKADSTAIGRINCNSHFNTFSIQGGKLILKGGGATLVGCDESWAENFFKVLRNPDNSPNISVNGAVLTLVSANLKRKVTMNKF